MTVIVTNKETSLKLIQQNIHFYFKLVVFNNYLWQQNTEINQQTDSL